MTRAALLLFVFSACATTPASRAGGSSDSAPTAVDAGNMAPGSSATIDAGTVEVLDAGVAIPVSTPCPETFPTGPMWLLTTRAPLASGRELTGQWMPVPADSPAGPIKQGPFCWRGYEVLSLVQRGARVTASWAFGAGVGGQQRPMLIVEESGEGQFRDGHLVVEGWRRTSDGRAGPLGRECRAVAASLTLDERGHLVGIWDGRTVRLAPLILTAAPNSHEGCGPPPP